ncbi:hypothetical protein CCACVL1_11064 [Corchorus capsularis]|uniref:Uncharacterized protein n=1 Tax=Corchorus capsularis TaxID=210143 RepID=A0A1R3IN54_COCAP|nr:hypothetical protein CCACVL1_11064 [Corchorus capsularis]
MKRAELPSLTVGTNNHGTPAALLVVHSILGFQRTRSRAMDGESGSQNRMKLEAPPQSHGGAAGEGGR